MKRFSWLNWLLVLSLCGNAVLGAVLVGRTTQRAGAPAPVSASAPASESASSAASSAPEEKKPIWVLRQDGDNLEPEIIEIGVKENENYAIVTYFLERFHVGYKVHEVIADDVISDDRWLNEYRIALSQTETWSETRAEDAFFALNSIYETFKQRSKQYKERDAQLLLRLHPAGPLTFPIPEYLRTGVTSGTWSIPADVPFTGTRDYFLRLQEQEPRQWSFAPQPTYLFGKVSPLRDDPIAQELDAFLGALTYRYLGDWRGVADFTSPQYAEPSFVNAVAVSFVNMRYPDDEVYASLEKLETDAPYFLCINYGFISEADVEYAARQIFGDTVPINHNAGVSGSIWRWYYHEAYASYSPFPGGSFMGIAEPLILKYDFIGDKIVVQAAAAVFANNLTPQALVTLRDGTEKAFDMDNDKNLLDPQGFWNCLVTEAARVEFTLTKKPDGGFWFTGCKQLDPLPPS